MSELSGQINVGYLSAKAIFGPGGGAMMTVLICLALISSLSSLIMVGPRVTQTMGEDLARLRFFAGRNARGAPVFAIILQALVAIFLTLTATFNAVLTYVGFTLALFASLTVLGVFVLRLRHPDLPRPFKTWGYPVTPAIFLVLYGWMICYLCIERPLPSVCGLLTVASGLLLYKLLATQGPRRSQENVVEPSIPRKLEGKR
jgi:APA family basic amino acid/polyamine antiporter